MNNKSGNEPFKTYAKGTRYTSADPSRLCEADAQVLGEELEELAEDGIPVTPTMLLLRAKNPASPLHKHFEWNDTLAAREHRKHQARKLVQTLQVVVVGPSGPRRVPSHFSVTTEGASVPVQEYVSVKRAREEPLVREQVYQKAVQELLDWAHRYEAFGLEELTPVYEIAAKFGK